MNKLYFQSNNEEINQVFRIALGDLYGNIRMFQSGLLKEKEAINPCRNAL